MKEIEIFNFRKRRLTEDKIILFKFLKGHARVQDLLSVFVDNNATDKMMVLSHRLP